MSHWHEFDHVIINDDLDRATTDLEYVITGNGADSRADNPEIAAEIKNILV